jgi:hypothetical protein
MPNDDLLLFSACPLMIYCCSLHAHWWSTAVLCMPTDDLLLFSACPLMIYCCYLHAHRWSTVVLCMSTDDLLLFSSCPLMIYCCTLHAHWCSNLSHWCSRLSDLFDNINFCSRKDTGGIELSYNRQCPFGSYVPCTGFRHSLLCALCMCLLALNGRNVRRGWFTHAVPGDTYIQECPATEKFRIVLPTPNYRYFGFYQQISKWDISIFKYPSLLMFV